MTVNEIYELVGGNIIENIKYDNWTQAKLFIQGDNNYVETKGLIHLVIIKVIN